MKVMKENDDKYDCYFNHIDQQTDNYDVKDNDRYEENEQLVYGVGIAAS